MNKNVPPKHYHYSCYLFSNNAKNLLKSFVIQCLSSMNGLSKTMPIYVSGKNEKVIGEAKISMTFALSLKLNVSYNKVTFIAKKLYSHEKINLYIKLRVLYHYLDSNIRKYCWSDKYFIEINFIKNAIKLNFFHISGLRRFSIEDFLEIFYQRLIDIFREYDMQPDVKIIKI